MTQPAPPAAPTPDAATAGTGTPGAPVADQPGVTGAIVVALAVPQDVLDALPVGAEEPDPDDTDGQPDPDDAPSVALVTLPKPDTIDPPSFLIAVLTAVRDAAAQSPAIAGQVSGIGRGVDPDGDGGDEWFALVDAPDIDVFRASLVTALGQQAAPDGSPLATPEHGYLPRIVLGDLTPDAALPQQRLDPLPATFGTVLVTQDEVTVPVPLGAPASNPAQPDAQGQPVQSGDVAVQPGQLTPDSTSPSATKGKGKGGPPIARGSWVAVGNQSGRVDLVVTTGKVPGVDGDVEGSESDPALRVVVYEQVNGSWRSTGDKIGTRVSKAKRTAPLTARGSGKKDAGYAALVGLQAEHEVRVQSDGLGAHTVPTGTAIKSVFERGVASWPGPDRTVLDAPTWGVERVKAFLGTCAGQRPAGYCRDDDLLPVGHPERKAIDATTVIPDGDAVEVPADEVKDLLASLRGTVGAATDA